MTYYIVEHSKRGTLRPDSEPGQPHFSWSGHRSSPDTAWQFHSVTEAVGALNRCVTSLKTRSGCVVRQSPSDGHDYDRPGWPDDAWKQVYP